MNRVVPEHSTITGKRHDRAEYVWDDYSEGVLTVRRSTCGSRMYDCVWKITISEREHAADSE